MISFSSLQISTVLREAAVYLKANDISSDKLDARLLLQHAVKQPAEFLICEPDHLCTNDQLRLFEQLLRRRAQREPVSKIIGVREFWGLPFMVTQDVLDPRPDSETLIEAVREVFHNRMKAYRILDLGVGSGCLLLSLLHEFPKTSGVGVDMSPAALQVAQTNAIRLDLSQRAEFIFTSWGNGLAEQFDLIVSNPPYIPHQVIATLDAEVRQYDPMSALDGGTDGLDCYRQLAPEMFRLLKPEGRVFIEIGQGQEKDVESIFQSCGFSILYWHTDLQGIMRCGVFYKDNS